MPSLTRQQASLQAADALATEHADELSQSVDATSSFFKLPPELQISVVEYVTRPSDLKSMCQAFKELQALTLPYLYRDVRLMTNQLNKKLSNVFTASHPGLPHIRSLRIKDWCTPLFDNKNHLHVLCHLLKAVPKNSLRIFELHTTNPVHQDVSLLLRTRQRQLTNYQYLRLVPDSRPFTPPIWTTYGIGHISCLQLFLKNARDCKMARHLLNHMPLLTELDIKHTPVHPPEDASEAGRRVINDLFDPTSASRRHQKFKRLRIEDMSFEVAGAILPTVLPLGNLEHLHLIRCRYTNRLCESIAQLQLCLRSFHNQSSHEDPRTGVMDAFVKSLRDLRGLRLSRRSFGTGGYETCDFASLLPHAHELRYLELDDYEPWEEVFTNTRRSLTDFSTFCSRASQLQQLALQSPSLAEVNWKAPHGLQDFLDCLQDLRNLRVLKLTTQLACFDELDLIPDDDEDEDDELLDEVRSLRLDKACKEAEEEAKVAANHTFEALGQTCPFFVALAVTVTEPHGGSLSELEFLRVKQTDLLGKTTFVARSVKSGTIRYYEPCSEILRTVHDVGVFEY